MAPPTGTTDIDFLRSTTTITTDRQADGDTSTQVTHRARFGIKPGTVTDLTQRFGSKVFRPQWLTAEWRDGLLHEVHVSGPLVLKSGGTSTKAPSLYYDWRAMWRTGVFDRTEVPETIAAALVAYELAIAGQSQGGTSL